VTGKLNLNVIIFFENCSLQEKVTNIGLVLIYTVKVEHFEYDIPVRVYLITKKVIHTTDKARFISQTMMGSVYRKHIARSVEALSLKSAAALATRGTLQMSLLSKLRTYKKPR
jgi:hypothetical protein